MLQSVAASAILIALAFILFVVFSFKGLSMGPSAFICAIVVSLATADPLGVLTGTFLTTAFNFACTIILPFALAGLFSELMTMTGSSEAVGVYLVNKLGKNNAPLIIALVTVVLNLAGITNYVFIVVPIAFSVLRAADLPRRIGVAIMQGVATVVFYGLPGIPCPVNLMPTTFLGTDLYAAPVLSIVISVFAFTLIGLFTAWQVKDARKRGEGYDPAPGEELTNHNDGEKQIIPFGIAVLPIVIVVVGCFILQKALGVAAMASISISLLLGSVFLFAVYWNKLPERKIAIFDRGFTTMFSPVVGTALIVGFAGIVQTTSAYNALLELITKLDINPYATTTVSIMFIALICANGVSGLSIFMQTFGAQFAMMPEVNTEALHRLACSTACTLDSMPHNAATCMNLSIFRLSHKEGYFGIFVNTVIITTLMALLCLVLCIVFY